MIAKEIKLKKNASYALKLIKDVERKGEWNVFKTDFFPQPVNFQMCKLDLEKADEPQIKLPTSAGSLKKQESSRKMSSSALLTMPKPLTM